MLARHTFFYFLARGVPGLINFLAIFLYTRLLLPEEYGIYALVLIVSKMAGIVAFQWLRLGAFRFYAAHLENNMDRFLSSILVTYIVLMVAITGLYGVGYATWSQFTSIEFIWVLGILFMFATNWFEMNLSIMSAQLSPIKYGLLSLSRAIITLVVGIVLVFAGLSADALMIGLLVGNVVPVIFIHRNQWGELSLKKVDFSLIRKLVKYGMPLTITFAMGMIIYGMDRIMLGWLLGEREIGLYAVSYDFIQQTLLVIMSVIVSAGSPIIIRKFEQGSLKSTLKQMEETIDLLLIISLPSAIGIILLSPNLGFVLFGAEFRDAAALIMPWVAPAVLLSGIKETYFDMPFTLKKQTHLQVYPVLIAAILNLILNYFWITAFGMLGAAYASLVSYSIAMAVSIIIGRRILKVPIPWLKISKTILSTLCMGASLMPFLQYKGALALIFQVTLGIVVYFFCGWLLNIGGLRNKFQFRHKPNSQQKLQSLRRHS